MRVGKVEYKDLYEFTKISYNENNIYYSISFDERIFGYLIFKLHEDLELIDIYIREDFRNSGYGSKLLNFAMYDSISLGFDKIIVKNHKNLDNFLEKNDFRNVNNIYMREELKKELEIINTTIKISRVSLVINILLSVLKLTLGYAFSINSLIADGINSFSDLINNILVMIAAKIEKEPNDEDHPYGHGKVDSIFSLIIGVIIIITSLDILKTGIVNLVIKKFDTLLYDFKLLSIIMMILVFLKLLQYLYVYFRSKKAKNQLLKALLLDYNVDILLSVGVFLGIIATKYISSSIDSILSIIISTYLIIQGYKVVKENSLILMDSQDEVLLLQVKSLTLEIEEIKNIHDMYMTRIGKNIYVVADIRLDSNISLENAHDIASKAEKNIKFRFSNIKKVIYHIEPMYNEEKK